MSDNYIIEIRPKSAGVTVQAGIVVRDGGRFRFFAATHKFNSLDGELFKTPRAAEHAALRCVTHVNLPRSFPVKTKAPMTRGLDGRGVGASGESLRGSLIRPSY
jgi:hypothetical protein